MDYRDFPNDRKLVFSLDPLRSVLNQIGNPHEKLGSIIHVAGTNGKGSTLAFLHALLKHLGYRVHRYTSPHLVSLSERITLNGCPIDDSRLSTLCSQVETLAAGTLTPFEKLTASAFWAFSQDSADYTLLEVGVGGEFDATNVISQPVMTLITALSLDHQEFLGASLEDIALAKAGILKPKIPLVVAEQPPEAMAVIHGRARELQVPVYAQGKIWRIEKNQFIWEDKAYPLPHLGLQGNFQYQNAGLAAAALAVHLPHTLAEWNDVRRTLANTVWPGRLQPLSQTVWVDGAHNEGGAYAVAQAIASWPAPVTVVVGILQRKDAHAFLKAFQNGPVRHVIAVPIKDRPAWATHDLSQIAVRLGFQGKTSDSFQSALKDAQEDHPSRILITGSLYLVGEVLRSCEMGSLSV